MTGNESAPTAVRTAQLVKLHDLGYLRANGPDADGFLQGQLSNDLRLLTPQRAQLSSYNSPKGRMLAVLHLFRHGESVILEVHRSVLEATLKRLRMFVLRSRLKLDDASGELPALGLIGAGAAERLRRIGLPVPETSLETAHANGLLIMRRAGDVPRYSLHGSATALSELEQTLDARDGAAETWKRLDIQAGLPTIYPQTQDHFVPQMCNLDLLGGVSFDKGCYTGQEIVARLHYLGQVKRRLFRARVGGVAAAGQEIFDAGSGTQAVGEVVDAVSDGSGNSLLAVLQLGHARGDLRLDSLQGLSLTELAGPTA
jgi:hypothetical protein